MDATSFELNASFPADARFADVMRAVAEHAARYAGCRGDDAEEYAGVVESVALMCLADVAANAEVLVIVRRAEGPVECLIGCERRFTAAASADPHITVDWMRHANHEMCRIARRMPADC